ncbi:hypothetical protein Vi05172_g11573 [Venturia inaequalis]|nr:hypothetical protein Vi05172_g11573 [Venturia inaequalis]
MSDLQVSVFPRPSRAERFREEEPTSKDQTQHCTEFLIIFTTKHQPLPSRTKVPYISKRTADKLNDTISEELRVYLDQGLWREEAQTMHGVRVYI